MGSKNRRNHAFGKSYGYRKGHKNMEENKQNKEQVDEVPTDDVMVDEVNPTPAEDHEAEAAVEEAAVYSMTEEERLRHEVEELKAQVEKEKKEYMFLMAEMDNYRKRTLKEKSELIKNAAEGAFKGLLPVVDDMERAIVHSDDATDPKTLREGMELIYKKLRKYMEQNGVKEMETNDKPFDADKEEAIAMVPAPADDKKGVVLDTVEKGYTINDKVLRHAKVVVGQ